MATSANKRSFEEMEATADSTNEPASEPPIKKSKLPENAQKSSPEFPPALIQQILSIVLESNNTNDTSMKDSCYHDIVQYLSQFRVCLPCIYRICNGFACISEHSNANHLLLSLLQMEQKLDLKQKHCFVCNDIYLRLYESITTKQFVSSGIHEYEYDSYYLVINIPPMLTIRDFYVVHRLHTDIAKSRDIISLPTEEQEDSHRDFLNFMIENLCKEFRDIPSKVKQQHFPSTAVQTNCNKEQKAEEVPLKNVKNKFGYTAPNLLCMEGIMVTFQFYHGFINHYVQTAKYEADPTLTKQAKKRSKYKRWKDRKKKRRGQKRDEDDEPQWENTECPEYEMLKTEATQMWMDKNHYMNNLKLFLLDLNSFRTLAELCTVNAAQFASCTLSPWEDVKVDTANICDVKIEIKRPNIYIAGEYNKYSREVSQTPFPFTKTSVLTLIVQQMRKWKTTQSADDDSNDNNTNTDGGTEKANDQQKEEKEGKDAADHDKSRILNPFSNEFGWVDVRQNVASNNLFCCDHVALHSAGREDADVRMLGAGRPLLLQLLNPRKVLSLLGDSGDENELKAFETFCNQQVGGMIALRNLRVVDESHQEWMKSIESSKTKTYNAICWISKAIKNQAELDGIFEGNKITFPLEIKQWTPVRVLHRRALAERSKLLYDIKITWMSSQWVSVDITSEAGTYIKEFCHGDRGRTSPSLSTLLQCNNAHITQLDVTSVQTGDNVKKHA